MTFGRTARQALPLLNMIGGWRRPALTAVALDLHPAQASIETLADGRRRRRRPA